MENININRSVSESDTVYAGNPWTAYNSFLLYFIIAASLIVAIWTSVALQLLAPVPFYFFLGSQMYYFRLSDELLIIRNQYFFWYKKTYYLRDIRSVTYRPRGRLSSM